MAEGPPTPTAAPPLNGQRVLVVEDEFLLAEDLRRALVAAGARVMGPVPGIEAALALLDSDPAPSLAVLDVNLQGRMVWPLADVLAARGVPFIFATGYDGDAIPQPHAHVTRAQKPVDAQQLVQLLAAAL